MVQFQTPLGSRRVEHRLAKKYKRVIKNSEIGTLNLNSETQNSKQFPTLQATPKEDLSWKNLLYPPENIVRKLLIQL